MSAQEVSQLQWGLSWIEPPPAPPGTAERPLAPLPNLDFLAVLLAARPGTWARLLHGLDQKLAHRVALQVERDQTTLEAVSRQADESWGIWARCRTDAQAPAQGAPGATTAPPAPAPAPTPLAPRPPAQGPVAVPAQAPAAQAPQPSKHSAEVRRLTLTDDEVRAVHPFRPGAHGGARRANVTGRSEHDHARLAQVYVRLHKDGDTSPPATIAEAVGATASFISAQVKISRTMGLLTASPQARKPGGELTARARTLLWPRQSLPTPAPSSPPPPPLTPTPAQLAEIERLKAEGRAQVESLRRPAAPGMDEALLPATCRPIASVRELPEQVRAAAESAIAAGWAIGVDREGHFRWVHKNGSAVTVSPHEHRHATRKSLGRLRRAGVPTPNWKPAPGARNDLRWPEGIGRGDCNCDSHGTGKPRWFTGCGVHTTEPDRSTMPPPPKRHPDTPAAPAVTPPALMRFPAAPVGGGSSASAAS